jgi:hypothetical protein
VKGDPAGGWRLDAGGQSRLPAVAITHPAAAPLRRWLADGDAVLADLRFDPDPACIALWDFVLSEEERLRAARAQGGLIVAAMKDLGTVPVLVEAIPGARAFYPDGAWWLPCLQLNRGGQLAAADRLGIGEAFCPVRALLGCYAAGSDFPAPDLDICAVGATCDDFSAIAQRLAGLGRDILWWELPPWRAPDPGEAGCTLPDGTEVALVAAQAVERELARLVEALGRLSGRSIGAEDLAGAVARAAAVRAEVAAIRRLVFAAPRAPLPALELLLIEALALHFCSDLPRCRVVLADLHRTVAARVAAGIGVLLDDAVRTLWINPVADLRVLQWYEELGGRLCATDFMTAQAFAAPPDGLPPLAALARTALCDRMIGSDRRRAALATADGRVHGVEAAVVARIPGASHGCGEAPALAAAMHWPHAAIEVPPVATGAAGQIRGRLEALIETARARREAA